MDNTMKIFEMEIEIISKKEKDGYQTSTVTIRRKFFGLTYSKQVDKKQSIVKQTK
jgi:hypothetical protein